MLISDIKTATRKQLAKFVEENKIKVDFSITDTINPLNWVREQIEIAARTETKLTEIPMAEGEIAKTEDSSIIVYRTPLGTEVKLEMTNEEFKTFNKMEEIQNKIDEIQNEIDELYDSNKDPYDLEQKRNKLRKELENLEITPKLFFQFIKAKMTQIEIDLITTDLQKLGMFLENTKITGQRGLYEEIASQISVATRQAELKAHGINYIIKEEVINGFKNHTKVKGIRFKSLDQFPRIIPGHIAELIGKFKERNLFDDYKILYIDATNTTYATTKQKIEEKDPILFGYYENKPDFLYYIIDWIDEYCDLTLEKFLTEVKKDNPEYQLANLPEFNTEYFNHLMNEANDRNDRLARTNSRNYRRLMEEEESTYNQPTTLTKEVVNSNDERKSWFKQFIDVFKF